MPTIKQETDLMNKAARALAEADFYFREAVKSKNIHVADKYIARANEWLAEGIDLAAKAMSADGAVK